VEQKRDSLKTAAKQSILDYDRSLNKSYEAAQKKKRAGKGVAQLGQQSQQSIPLVVPNEYGSNLNLLEEVGGYEVFLWFYQDTGLDLAQVLVEGPSAPEVDPYKKFELGQILYNPEKLGELGTQMYLLNGWYMSASKGGQIYLHVRIRNHHYFRGNDIIYVEFSELRQLCHLDSLDKSLISCYYM
jgi:hypothetical protein